MRGVTTAMALTAAALLAAAAPAEAGCTRRIVNKSPYTALVSRDGGPWVAIPPRRAQTIRYTHPGTVSFALVCGRPYAAPEAALYRGSFTYSAILDRCYVEIGEGFFEEQLGPSFGGTIDTKPLTMNVPRQGDVVIGPMVEGGCPASYRATRETLRARY